MSVLVFAENNNGKFKKSALEAVHYGYLVAQSMGMDCNAVVLGINDQVAMLGEYGAKKVLHVVDSSLNSLDSQLYTNAISQIAENVNASVIVVSHSYTGKTILGRIAVRLNAGSVSGVNSLVQRTEHYKVKKSVFSGKAIAEFEIRTEKCIVSLMGNSFPPEKVSEPCIVDSVTLDLPSPKINIKEVKTVEGTVPLPEAELVVSAGRGMKDAANWGIIEDLANELGATTACSRPVADVGWRPHHEHVGQTGIAIRPNLYIAIGISGAIQHLAGVNNSKVIVVVNKDPEAPFFKAADYGVCADLFDVVPRLTEALKRFKQG
jgi:electron transfer flavoprotein alpha subunit